MPDQVDAFLKHYGVQGMKKPVPPQKLGRVYRVAAGTATLKDRIQKVRQATSKNNAAAKLAEAESQNSDITPDGEDLDASSDAILGEALAKILLKSCGATKVMSLG